MSISARRRRGGFTLIELLIVIAIIGLLAGVTLVAMRGARGFGAAASARASLSAVEQALEIYKQKYGEYPPDCRATDAQIRRHIQKRWKNALKAGRNNVDNMVAEARRETDKGPGNALLFWLAGPNAKGFYADDADPFGLNASDDDPRETPIIELSYDSDGTGGGNYNDDGLAHKGRPMAYFRAEGKNGYGEKDFHVGEGNIAAPYMKNGVWYNADSFQLILPGEDGLYGDDPFGCEEHDREHEHAPGSEPYVARDVAKPDTLSADGADKDNIVNFGDGGTLEAEME